MNYLIGDVQGCCDALERLLAQIDFSPSRDRLWLLGDLVNRGPRSLATLRRLQALGSAATCLLGNHDLHLLAVAHGVRRVSAGDTLDDILAAPDRPALVDWLRQQHLARYEAGWLMVHAGVVPTWSLQDTLALAGEVEAVLRGPDLPGFLHAMYGNEPERWSPSLTGTDRLRFTVNALTRLRFCSADGRLDLKTKDGAAAAPPGFMPWFDVPGRASRGTPIAFGHWSTLGLLDRPDLLGLDTGCVWGGRLTAARLDGAEREIIQVDCEQARRPGP
ncbi:MAG: symmetrical bis(5'-nucleosyl)-tetraphosphatase [Roseateles sp.]|jgi:bis(5'-nucleosyl)-tetraphosphatase (symmetrical)|nr:bis(5'-nucleosyl)-tetraphosphatase (symmetrical) [Methylibium sp.]MBY0366817.1 symmetrical bis(5'-nucleosyl)-tetraphosphatase [Burkholderiaceae bacterium]|mmetsp:Transcript_4959/g.18006  ORF Transcript_4959/g.18006 Transcript_4959/m.18006 type:complete len:275 (-) Transcript_4959:517-1341(-)